MSPSIIHVIETESDYKNMVFRHKEDILTPHGPLTRESYISYCPFGLRSQGTSQTNKHNHLKQIEAESSTKLISIIISRNWRVVFRTSK